MPAIGAPLAKIIVPDRLQARLKVAEASTQDLALGLKATISPSSRTSSFR